MVLEKSVTIKVSRSRLYVFVILIFIAFAGVLFWALTSSCTYTADVYSEEHCDPSYLQIGQSLTLCSTSQDCYDTRFYSNSFIQYRGFYFNNCSANVTEVKILVVNNLPTWTSINSSITCDDGVSLYIKDISTLHVDPVNNIMTKLQSSVGFMGTMMLRVYSNSDKPAVGYFNGTNSNIPISSVNLLTNFENALADVVNGSYIPYGYVCHDCVANKGPFNNLFFIKFLTTLFSLMSTIFAFLSFVCTLQIASDYFELRKHVPMDEN